MRADVARFDSLLGKLGLPGASENDQEPAFTTIWFGIDYLRKESTRGLPKKKWLKLSLFIAHKFMSEKRTVKSQIDNADLLTGLCKLHHMTQVWTAGRPSLYALWVLRSTAYFSCRKK